METTGELQITSISSGADAGEDNPVLDTCEEMESPGAGVEGKVEDCDDVNNSSDQTKVTTCFFCDDSCFDVNSPSAYSDHVREVHGVTKNLDLLLQFIIEQETRGNTVVVLCSKIRSPLSLSCFFSLLIVVFSRLP